MQKISVTIDVSKIDKSRIVKNTYTNKNGEEITEMNYTFDVIEKKQPRHIKQGDTWSLEETHFVVEGQTKEEREAKKESNFIGNGTQFKNLIEQAQDMAGDEDIRPEDIPF